jgi:hypothetical protein
MYIVYNKDQYDKAEAEGKNLFDYCKLSAAGVSFEKYFVISDFKGLMRYALEKYKVEKGKQVIAMVNNGEIPLSEVKNFVYKRNPRRAFMDTYRDGFCILIREVFLRHIKDDARTGKKSSSVSVEIDTKILKRCDFIGTQQDKEMTEIINNEKKGIYYFLMTEGKRKQFASDSDYEYSCS